MSAVVRRHHGLVQSLISRLLVFVYFSCPSPAPAADQFELEVREGGGLARGGYPVHATLKLARPVRPTTNFRLLSEGAPVVAQFRPDQDGITNQWWLDFQTEIKPHEKKNYLVEFGDDMPAGPERTMGHQLTRTDQGFAISNAPYITWKVAHNLNGLLQSVDFPPSEFLKDDSPGLMLRDRQGREHPFAGVGRILREGPMAVALRFENTEQKEPLLQVRSAVDLTFPAPVSWVKVDWRIDDPLDKVSAVGLQLHLNLEKPESAATLVDFGASSVVYTSLRPEQSAELLAGPLKGAVQPNDNPVWEIFRRTQGDAAPLAVGRRPSSPQGWAHVMDRNICLGLALDAFARVTRDRIITEAGGKLTIWREFGPALKTAEKRLRLWLHFVHFPPQATAGASPQQMQSPLEVRMISR